MVRRSREYPSGAADTFKLGSALAEQGYFEEAARQFSTLVRNDPELDDPMSVAAISALMCLAECKGALGDWKEALKTAGPAMTLAVEIIGHFAYFMQKAGNHEQAAFLYTVCTQLVPDHEDFLHGAAFNKMMCGSWEPALRDLRRALKLEPHSPGLWYEFGNTLVRMGKTREARPVFRKVLRLDPKHSLAWYDLACLDALEGKAAQAFRNLNRAVDYGFLDPAYLMTDPDFSVIQGDPRWERVVARVERKAARKAGRKHGRHADLPLAAGTDTVQ